VLSFVSDRKLTSKEERNLNNKTIKRIKKEIKKTSTRSKNSSNYNYELRLSINKLTDRNKALKEMDKKSLSHRSFWFNRSKKVKSPVKLSQIVEEEEESTTGGRRSSKSRRISKSRRSSKGRRTYRQMK
jgi:hypothetical protein